ncbi:MAG: polyamine aminopropyltransferase [Bacteroidota bacterium]
MKVRANILKLALFATGLSGIVAEYILSTLATYFLGDSVFQWTMIVSVMLFSMGLGSRLSRLVRGNLLGNFVAIEFVLSVLVSFSSLAVYSLASRTPYTGPLIYGLSIAIGILIGMEIPLVIRLNEAFESLRINVSSVMEKDYFGSLLGGVFFAFVGLPILGLTYTPFLLGGINFLVALLLYLMLRPELSQRENRYASFGALLVLLLWGGGLALAEPVILYGEQRKYRDKIIYQEQSRYQKIVLTSWKGDYWLYLNSNQQFSTRDEVMYHEPLVHPGMRLSPSSRNVLILGGGDGCAAREVLKYPEVEKITLVDLDPAVTDLAKTHPVLTEVNQYSLEHPKVTVLNQDGYQYIEETEEFYDVILIDLPDPRTVELSRLYSYEFYSLCKRHLRPHGVLVTQSGSPYFASKAFQCVRKTLKAADFTVVSLHNQIVTMGEWGWQLAVKTGSEEAVKEKLLTLDFDNVPTAWINQEAMQLMTSFGKDIFTQPGDSVRVNRIHDPVLYRYYLKGNWDLY